MDDDILFYSYLYTNNKNLTQWATSSVETKMAGDAVNPSPGGGAATEDEDLDSNRGFNDTELAACIKVLRALGNVSKDDVVGGGGGGDCGGGDDGIRGGGGDCEGHADDGPDSDGAGGVSPMFHHKAHKQLRVALQPLLAELKGQLFRGKDPKAYKAAKQGKRDLNRRQMMERAADRESLNNTRMRAERLARLAALEAGHDEVLAIGDGRGDQDENTTTRRRALPLIPDGCTGASASIPLIRDDGNTLLIGNGGSGSGRGGSGGANDSTVDVMGTETGARTGDDNVAADRVTKESGGGRGGGGVGGRTSECGGEEAAAAANEEEGTLLNIPRQCYVCKGRYRRLHHFYGSLCPPCADMNWRKRRQTADLTGRVAIVTGSRVKIGYRITLKLLRCGAAVVATTRFPVDARRRFEAEPDASEWLHRLTVVAMDLRDLPGLERLCAHLTSVLPRLDVIINNACQTVRRPPAYYKHLLRAEAAGAKDYLAAGAGAGAAAGNTPVVGLLAGVGHTINIDGGIVAAGVGDGGVRMDGSGGGSSGNVGGDGVEYDVASSGASGGDIQTSADVASEGGGWRRGDVGTLKRSGWMAPSAAASQLQLLPGDAADPAATAENFPAGVLDVNGQQVDLRQKHSWTMRLGEVETPELLEVLAVNAAAPFVLNGKLRGLMARTAALGPGNAASQAPLATASAAAAAAGADGGGGGGDGEDHVEGETTEGDVDGGSEGNKRAGSNGGSHNQRDGDRLAPLGRAFIVNVSAMEGKFYRYKTANHPHTNMAKAALNMMTATAAADYATQGIYMNAVDTGWINDENPLETAARIAKDHSFQTPIDEEDAAARCVAPVLEGVAGEGSPGGSSPPFGKFFKDYRESEW